MTRDEIEREFGHLHLELGIRGHISEIVAKNAEVRRRLLVLRTAVLEALDELQPYYFCLCCCKTLPGDGTKCPSCGDTRLRGPRKKPPPIERPCFFLKAGPRDCEERHCMVPRWDDCPYGGQSPHLEAWRKEQG